MKQPVHFLTVLFILTLSSRPDVLLAQENDTIPKNKQGWTFGGLPVVSYDTDIGFQYGLLVNFFEYGDGSMYPDYRHSIYMEWSRTTKGSGINRFYYDSEYLIPKIRLTADISYLTEKAMNFYGFDGYDAIYNQNFENDTHPDYISRVFYRHERSILRILANFSGNLLSTGDKLKWIAGATYYGVDIASVDIDQLNKNSSDPLPDTAGLYDNYVDWGIIKPEEKDGNKTTYVKAGLIYDTRDAEANPFKGIWSEAVISYAPGFLTDAEFEYAKLTLIHRQYFTLYPKKLSFAYRLAYQGTLFGEVPFHTQPHIVPTVMRGANSQGLGGAKSLRGIRRNRVVGDGAVLGNVELRWKFLETRVFNQNLYLATNVFYDFGMVVQKMDRDLSGVPAEVNKDDFFAQGTEALHMTAGIGLKIALNENFIISVDYGKAFDVRDGDSGLYIGLNFLY